MTGSIGWWTWLLWWFGKPFAVKAPACTPCGWKLHGLRFLGLTMTVAICVAVVWWIWPGIEDFVPRGFRKWVVMGLGLVCLLPLFIFQVFFANPFDITAYAKSVDYDFTSRDYAFDFAMLNQDAEWVKVNGEVIE